MDNFDEMQFITRYTFHVDESKPGRILETVKVGGVYISRLTIEPGIVTGNLYHKHTNVVLFCAQGTISFRFYQMKTEERRETIMKPGSGLIHVPPYVVIANKNISYEPAVLIYFSNKPFRSGDDFPFEIFLEST